MHTLPSLQNQKYTVTALLIVVGIVFVAIVFSWGERALADHALEPAYVTSHTTTQTHSCSWDEEDWLCTDGNNASCRPWSTCTQGGRWPNGRCYVNSCTGAGPVCGNNLGDPGTYTTSHTSYTCHYISAVTAWSACSAGTQVATAATWSTKSGQNNCNNVPLVQACISPPATPPSINLQACQFNGAGCNTGFLNITTGEEIRLRWNSSYTGGNTYSCGSPGQTPIVVSGGWYPDGRDPKNGYSLTVDEPAAAELATYWLSCWDDTDPAGTWTSDSVLVRNTDVLGPPPTPDITFEACLLGGTGCTPGNLNITTGDETELTWREDTSSLGADLRCDRDAGAGPGQWTYPGLGAFTTVGGGGVTEPGAASSETYAIKCWNVNDPGNTEVTRTVTISDSTGAGVDIPDMILEACLLGGANCDGTNLNITTGDETELTWREDTSSLGADLRCERAGANNWVYPGAGATVTSGAGGVTEPGAASSETYTINCWDVDDKAASERTTTVQIDAAAGPVNGICDPATNGGSFADAAAVNTSGLCSQGTSPAVSGAGPWNWTCSGSGGGSNDPCSALVIAGPVNGICDPATNGGSFADAAAVNTSGLCSQGTSPAVSGAGPWNWTCSGSGGGSNDPCSALVIAGPVNGICDPATNGGSFADAAAVNTSGLCSQGTSPAVSGAGPWNWTCSGSGGGSNDPCSALVIPSGPSITTDKPSVPLCDPVTIDYDTNGCAACTVSDLSGDIVLNIPPDPASDTIVDNVCSTEIYTIDCGVCGTDSEVVFPIEVIYED